MNNIFIFHGTGGYPGENWFPWLKSQLEGSHVEIPQFPNAEHPNPDTWYQTMQKAVERFDESTILIGHSLGGAVALRALERTGIRIHAAFLVAASIGILPIKYYDGDKPFLEGGFDWNKIRESARNFFVFHSDNDSLVCLGNGEKLAQELETDLIMVPNAGHFNAKAGYTEFPLLLEKLRTVL